MALLPDAPTIPATLSGDDPVLYDEGDVVSLQLREWDEEHTYVSTTLFNRLDMVVERTYPTDPDWDRVSQQIRPRCSHSGRSLKDHFG
jgi:hypothetical protein